MRKTGRKPIECKCRECKKQCATPCLGTPEDILRLLRAGYRDRLAPTEWCVGMMFGRIPYAISMVQAIQTQDGCTFFHNGLCELHTLGLKPTEGRLSYHTITKENVNFSRLLSWNVAKEWTNKKNAAVMNEIYRLMA